MITDQERKEIYQWKRNKKQKEEQFKQLDEETRNRKLLVEGLMKDIMPATAKYIDHMEKAANSEWFAYSELERLAEHNKVVHSNGSECMGNECFEDFSREDFLEYTNRILDAMKRDVAQ